MNEAGGSFSSLCPALSTMWVRRDPHSQGGEEQLLLGIITASIRGRACGSSIHTQQQTHPGHSSKAQFCSSIPNTEVRQSSRGFLYRVPKEDAQVAKTEQPVLACIWAQITAKMGDSSPAFPMRSVSAESSVAQQPWGGGGGSKKCSDQTAQTHSSQEALTKDSRSD